MVAHRAGNDPGALREALALGAHIVELDLHLRRGRLEVRHAKSVLGSPVLWERWWLEDGLRRPAALGEVLDAIASAPAPPVAMLDLKGADPRMPGAVRRALDARARPAPVMVCGRVWRNLAPLAGLPGVTVVHSAGSPRQLRALLRRFAEGGAGLEGVSVKRTLLDAATVGALRRRTDLVMTWPVDDARQAEALAGWGVTALITDHAAPLVAWAGAHPAAGPPA
ncbi:MAG TPA: hypothetical protein VNT51_09385 [Miltoncostaeaceae bacterium]|nr:hypothetical protein [Miltoncostaeaceae bacterium]